MQEIRRKPILSSLTLALHSSDEDASALPGIEPCLKYNPPSPKDPVLPARSRVSPHLTGGSNVTPQGAPRSPQPPPLPLPITPLNGRSWPLFLHWVTVNSEEVLICFVMLNKVNLPQNMLALIPLSPPPPPPLSRISFCRILKLLTSALLGETLQFSAHGANVADLFL